MKIIYDPNLHNLEDIRKIHKSKDTLICSDCRSELIIALTLKDANQFKLHPGIYCPKDDSHVGILVNLVEVREKMREVLSKLSED